MLPNKQVNTNVTMFRSLIPIMRTTQRIKPQYKYDSVFDKFITDSDVTEIIYSFGYLFHSNTYYNANHYLLKSI